LDGAKATADAARARLQQLQAGYRPEEIAQAERDLEKLPAEDKKAAQAKINAMKAGFAKEQIEFAKAELQRAEVDLRLSFLDTGSDEVVIKPGDWFTYEIIAQGNHITLKVNGKTTAVVIDSNRSYSKGRIALMQHDPASEVQFRKIEIKEMPATKSPMK
jgi:hypothetical protein